MAGIFIHKPRIMFRQIFFFEFRYRLRRPAFYIYFLFILVFSLLGFANGAVPVIEKELINAPAVLAVYLSTASVFLMLVSSAIMGVPLYRDIEHNTKEYYLSYPITKAGYFWGRYLGSFFFVVLIAAALLPGIYFGCKMGAALGWMPASRFGVHHLSFYLQPFFILVVPSLFVTSSLFFGLVAIFRNVKVIYSSGMFLFLGYILGNFFLRNIHDPKVIFLTDPFLVNGLRMLTDSYPVERLNSAVIPFEGLVLVNRLLWVGIGALGLVWTYRRFSFERFFGGQSGRAGKAAGLAAGGQAVPTRTGIRAVFRQVNVKLEGSYFRKTLFSLTRIEILNIVRDNYFWIILTGGLIFLTFVFWHGPSPYNVSDLPRAAFFMDAFTNFFVLFIFFLIIFYTGETVNREKVTRYAAINDALPPPTWVLNGAKLISLCCLAVFLSAVPILVGVVVQLCKGYTAFNFHLYFSAYFATTLPKLVEMVLFSYAIHITVHNKFAAHGIGITVWALMAIASSFHYFNYNLLLYGFTPFAAFNDMDGIGHMLRPILWFNGYWLLGGALMVVLGSLFYLRGVPGSFREALQLARTRFRGMTRIGMILLFLAFLGVGGSIFYNVSVMHEYLTEPEHDERAVLGEKTLKKYEGLPLPRITRMRMQVALYPSEQREVTQAFVTVMNKGDRNIDSLLMDGDNLTEYSIRYNGQLLHYQTPLYYTRGKFNLFRPGKEASDYRLYVLPASLKPGDSALVEVNSLIAQKGFQNDLYARNQLYNGIFFNGGLPGLGYDDDEELHNNDKRLEHGLAARKEKEIAPEDPVGRRTLQSQVLADLVGLDITVSTSGDQTAVAPGVLEKEWRSGGRHYFHYVQEKPSIYMPFGIASARYAILRDTVLVGERPVNVEIYFHPAHGANVAKFMAGCKDAIRYFSRAFGPYPFGQLRVVESAGYGPYMATFTNTIVYTERFGWNADMRDKEAMDYIYYSTAEQVAHQWWGFQVAANHTVGARAVSDGLSQYAALALMRNKYGERGVQSALQFVRWDYDRGRRSYFYKENDLLHGNKGFICDSKASMVLNGLRGLIGEDSLNSALQDLFRHWKFRNGGDYAGGYDLYRVLQQHVPDSLQYYLRDSWEKVCLYDNKISEVKLSAGGKAGEYRVRMTVEVHKSYIDSSGNEHAARAVNDCIEIGVFGGEVRDMIGSTPTDPLYLKKHWLTAGRHVIELTVRGKPVLVGIDPMGLLIDHRPEDNRMNIIK